MKFILRITARENTMRDFMGGPPTIYDAEVLSQPNSDGKKARLTFPGTLAYNENKDVLRTNCVEHLKRFGIDGDNLIISE